MSKLVTKAVIPAAGMGTRFLPATKTIPKEMIPILSTPTIDVIVQEAVEAGIEEILIVTSHIKHSLSEYFRPNKHLEKYLWDKHKLNLLHDIQKIATKVKIHFVEQKKPLGLGDAIRCAQNFTKNDPFVVLLGDDVIWTPKNKSATRQLMDVYEEKQGSVVGVQEIPKDKVNSYGVVDPQEFVKPNLCQVKGFVEKPTPEKAPSNLAITGRYLFTSDIYKYLKHAKPSVGGEIQLTDSISALALESPVYALKYHGQYYDIGGKLGFVKATIHFALEDETISKDVQIFLESFQKK